MGSMSNFDKIVSLLSEILGDGLLKKKGEILFYCPECNHRKRKLSVNINTQRWHCWICEVSQNVKGKKLRTLLKRFNASREQFKRLQDLVDDNTPYYANETVPKILTLPKDFITLRDESESFFYQNAINYVKRRGLSSDDILKYNIGYCEDGKYRNRVILPSYDKDGILNFFVTRSINPRTKKFKYLNPNVEKQTIIFNEYLIDWEKPITLVEGAFDHIVVPNSIPLLGKKISEKLFSEIYFRLLQLWRSHAGSSTRGDGYRRTASTGQAPHRAIGRRTPRGRRRDGG